MINKTSSYQLIAILKEEDIPKNISNTPIEDLLKYNNLNFNFKEYQKA